MKAIALLIALMGGFGCLNVQAQSGAQPQMQGGVRFVSGGVGEVRQEAMHAVQGEYNLHLLFAEKGTGAYLASVKVLIMNKKGATILDTVSKGPFLYAQLPAGHYKIRAEVGGIPLTEEVSVGHKHATAVSFYWPRTVG